MAPLALLALLAAHAAAFPSCDNAGSLNEAVDQGLQSFLQKNACVSGGAVAELNKLFPDGFPKAVAASLRASGGADPGRGRISQPPAKEERAPFDAATLDLIALHLHGLLGKTISVECAPIASAAEWGHDPNCDKKNAVCGEMRFNGDTLKLMAGNLGSNGMNALRAEDQFGNTVVHELFHAVVSFVQNVSGQKSAFEAGSPKPQRFAYYKHWNGCEPEGKRVEYQLDWLGYQACATCNENSARQVGARVNLCSPQTVGKVLGLDGSGCLPPTQKQVSTSAPRF